MTASTPLVETTGGALARNAGYNLLGQALPLAVGVVAMPVVASHLGAARFGVLGLIWAVVGYFGLLDLGLGRATTKYVATCLARGDLATLRSMATLSVLLQIGLGVAGGIGLALLTPWLVGHAMSVPPPLVPEVKGAFFTLAGSIPLVSASAALRGVTEAAQRFDLVNLVRAPTAAAMFAVPAAVAAAGGGLVAIVAGLLVVRLLAAWAFASVIPRAMPGFSWEFTPAWRLFRPLASYSAWTAISNLVSPLLSYLERFFLAALAGIAAVGYYTGPAEAVTRLLIVPAALAGALFPAVSAADNAEAGQRGERLAATSLRYLLFTLAPVALVLVLLAEPIVRLWLGADYASRGAGAFAILAVGVLVNGLAHVPSAYLFGCGRPDLPAKFHLIELPLYALAGWFLIRAYGITGAALAWTSRVTVDALLLFAAMRHVTGRAQR